ncbi:MAG: hypothetical protein A3F70_06585 [Acidobacteria bacterium RIFCSPLOWO2_12_FULL_67_14]|nr:MAG: hypothetical protein A3F70_06585 [Acidobacteria bacterium RIFCSPLOWO2_12_FULL_67_14]
MGRVLSRSLGRKLMVTCMAVIGFVLLYEATTFDSRDIAPTRLVDPTLPAAGARLLFTATAYCKGTTTASGVGVRTGIAASDPGILPVGSVVNVSTDTMQYNGVYTIMDTGPKVQGRVLDIYMWSCREALAFGRRPVEVTVLRLGWNPSASTPSLVERLFRRRETARRTTQPATPPQPGAAPTESGPGPPGDAATAPAEPSPAEAPQVPEAVPPASAGSPPVAPASITP